MLQTSTNSHATHNQLFEANLTILLVNMSERHELNEFERGVIIERWLLDTERYIEEKTGHPKSTIHNTIEDYRENSRCNISKTYSEHAEQIKAVLKLKALQQSIDEF